MSGGAVMEFLRNLILCFIAINVFGMLFCTGDLFRCLSPVTTFTTPRAARTHNFKEKSA